MNLAAFRLALRQSVRTSVILAVGLGLFYWVVMASSSSFASDLETIPKFFLEPPRAFVAMVGGNADFLSPAGWLASGIYHPVVLALQAVGAFQVAAATGATELERGTLDLVLARPVSRASYLRARAAAGFVALLIVEAGGLIGALVSRQIVPGVARIPVPDMLRAFMGTTVLFAAFGAIAMWIFARASLRSRALGAAIGVIVGAFFINFVSLLFDQVAWLRFVTPFHYYRAGEILAREPFAANIGLLGAIAVFFAALAVWEFGRRDLTR